MPPATTQLFVIILLVLAAIVAIGAIAANIRCRRRRREVIATLEQRDWRIDPRPESSAREGAFAPFEGLGLRRGARAVRTVIEGKIDDTEFRVIEHRYTEHTGSSSRTIRHLASAIPCPARWPALRLTHEHLGTKILSMLGGEDLQLEDSAFNKRWRITTDDEEFAMLVLGPDVQEWLMADDARELWAIGGGWIACARRERLREESFERISRRPLELLRMLPGELSAYAPAR